VLVHYKFKFSHSDGRDDAGIGTWIYYIIISIQLRTDERDMTRFPRLESYSSPNSFMEVGQKIFFSSNDSAVFGSRSSGNFITILLHSLHNIIKILSPGNIIVNDLALVLNEIETGSSKLK